MFDKIKKGAQASIDASKKAAEVSITIKSTPASMLASTLRFQPG